MATTSPKPGRSGKGSGSSTATSYASTSAATAGVEEEETSSHSPANVLDFQKSVHKRLDAMTDRQDSITALSLWMIHHKTQCQKIAACWLAAMKRAKVSRRLHLFYLANDVVQSCRKKNAKIYLLAFKNVLKDAVVLVRDSSIKHKIERIFHIWEERETYFIDFINELRELLNDREKVTAHVSAANFKPQEVIESLRKVKMLETHVAMKQKQVASLKIDASKIEAVKELKDRSHSHDFAKQFDDSYVKMQGYVKMLENEVDQRSKLIENLENGQTFYEVQNDDAMVVANAYRNFGIRISNLKKRLIDYKDTLTDETDSPIPSPSAEAPSPGNTPPQDTGGDDMDMELSDPEDNAAGKIIAAEPYAPSGSHSLTDRLAAMGATLPGSTDPRHGKTAFVEGYNPAEQLQREKVAATDMLTRNSLDHKFLFSMVAAKAQPATGRRDKSVLKDLTEFAEKVKNPPPKDWSEFNKKRMEKQLAEQKAAEEAAVKSQLEQETVQPAEEYVPSSDTPGSCLSTGGKKEDNYQPSVQPAVTMSYTPTAVVATQLESSSSETSTSQDTAEFSNSQPLTGQYNPTNSTVTSEVQASSQQEVDSNSLQSMSWPPTNSPATEVTPSPPVQRPQAPISTKMSAPIRPPLLRPASTVIRTIAPHIQITQPVVQQSSIRSVGGPPTRPPMRPQSGVVTVGNAPPPPPTRTRPISNERQQEALNMLDSLHAESSGEVGNVPAQQGNRIQTLGNNISPVMNRNFPVMNRPPAPPRYNNYNYRPPPAKRPYEQYGGNYHYY